jgi:DNA-binding transcriptional LysR family regulator
MERLTALKVFRQVAELASFAEAGRRLGLSPAAISKNVSELEAHLAVRLINRTTRRVNLTEAGTVYYNQVVRILDDLDEADRSLSSLQNTPAGVLKVNAPVTFTLICLSRAIPHFLARYPQLSLDLDLDDRRVDILKEGYDLAIRGSDRLEDTSLIARKLMVMAHVLCAAPSYFDRFGMPEAPEDLARHNCVQFSLSGHADLWEFRKEGRIVPVAIDGRYKVDSSLAVRDALLAGFGLSLVPQVYVRQEIAQGRLRVVLEDWVKPETTIYAVYPSRRYLAPKLRVFLDFLVAELGDAPG